MAAWRGHILWEFQPYKGGRGSFQPAPLRNLAKTKMVARGKLGQTEGTVRSGQANSAVKTKRASLALANFPPKRAQTTTEAPV